MKMRINEAQNYKGELNKLINEQQSIVIKINVMKSSNEKYIEEYEEELTGEKGKKKKKKKKKKNKKSIFFSNNQTKN